MDKDKARVLIFLLVVIVVAGLLSYTVYTYLQTRPASVAAPAATEKKVVVAARPLALGTLLKEDGLKTIPWPANNLPAGYFERIEDVASRGLIQSVVENEPILEAKLAPKNLGAGLPPLIPSGKRALSIRTSEIIGVAGYVLPGTRVDVILTATPASYPEAITKVVLQNVEVVTAGQVIQKDSEGKPQTVSVVTLLVTPQDAEKLTAASSQGTFQLALRNPLDLEEAKTEGIELTSLLKGAPLPRFGGPARSQKKVEVVAAPPPPPVFNVEVIKGDQRSNVKF